MNKALKKALLLLMCAGITLNTACSKSKLSAKNETNTSKTQTVVPVEDTEKTSETTPEAKPEETTEAKPEAKPDTKPETTPETKPETTPKTKPETEPVTTPATEPETTPETTSEPKPEATPDTKPEATPETTPEIKPEDNILKGELKAIIEKIYSISEVKLPRTGLTELTADNSQYFIGTNKIEYVEGLASEPLMGSYAHSMVLLRVKDGADTDKIKAEIKNSVNPRKWICVGVEPDKVIVDNIDNLIILIMDNKSDKLHNAFLSLKK